MLNAHYLSRQAGLVGPRILFLLAWILVAPGHAFADPPKKRESKPGTAVSRPAPVFPLKKDKDGRYLVDQKGTPFLIAGESPQALMVNLTEKDAELFFASRLSHGFNAVWINLLCRKGTGGRPDGSTYDGLLPFKSPEDFAPPNEDYFARCDRMIRLAEKYGLLVILDPCETIDHLKPMLVQSLGVVSLSPLRDVVSETLAGRLAMPGLFDDSGLEDKATKRKSWLASTREDIKSALTEVKYERLGDDSFVKFRLADNVIVVNSDHPFVEEHSRSRAEKELTRMVAMVNLLTDVYALDIGVATGKLMSIREYRDKLMRYRAMQRRQSGTYIAKLLLQTQHDSEHNKRLEVVVSDALRYLG